MSGVRRVVVEADGASRGNPGPAAYGAVVRDAESGEVIATDAAAIGVASNNVAEYSGLIAGLRLAVTHAPGAGVEVRMDSQLVVEQMSGRWRIKHPDMAALAAQARSIAPAGTTYTWIPRERNADADRLGNEALDGRRSGVTVTEREQEPGPESEPLAEDVEARAAVGAATEETRGWGPPGRPTTLILIRHGVTAHTVDKRFSGGLGGSDPALTDEGRAQVRETADWLAPLAPELDLVIASPVRRAHQSAEIVAGTLGVELRTEPGFAEMEFGDWEGRTFAEITAERPEELEAWMGSLDVAPGGGESFRSVEARVRAARERLLAEHAGRTVAVVSHVTPIKTLVAHALDAPLMAIYRMELAPASVSVISYYASPPDQEGPWSSMRLFNARPHQTGIPRF